VPGVAKVVIWIVVFAACAAAGAVVAAHTDPFPPGVDDPGARPSTGTGGSPEPDATQTWRGTVVSETSHRFHVGGACLTAWRGPLELTVEPGVRGRIRGVATLRIRGGPDCDFPVAQVQADAVSVAVTGVAGRGELELRLSETGRDPVGSHDLGGLVNTLRSMRPALVINDRDVIAARGRVTVRVPDGDLGSYLSTSTFMVACTDGC
jgi:hypothetical protein